MNDFDEYYRQLAFNIAFYRRKCGLTQMQLAEMIDISRTHMSYIEAPNKTTPFSLNVLFRISDALDVELVKFFDFKK